MLIEYHLLWHSNSIQIESHLPDLEPGTLSRSLQQIDRSPSYNYQSSVSISSSFSASVQAQGYLTDHCVPLTEVPGRQQLRSVTGCQLSVPHVHRGTFGGRCPHQQSGIRGFTP